MHNMLYKSLNYNGIFTGNHAQNQSQSISFTKIFWGGMPQAQTPLGLGMLKHAWLYFVQLQVPYHYQRASAAPVIIPRCPQLPSKMADSGSVRD